ncbi:hypothetical protein GCM10010271_30610 [Streptomyces kurssanovii]|nr:hypothetical protein GCM10010271_30610 [Streptomyces kurssanovii]
MQIEFDGVHAGLLGADEGTQGVLRLDAHDPAMTDGEESQDSLASVDGGSRGTQPGARRYRGSLTAPPGDGTARARGVRKPHTDGVSGLRTAGAQDPFTRAWARPPGA